MADAAAPSNDADGSRAARQARLPRPVEALRPAWRSRFWPRDERSREPDADIAAAGLVGAVRDATLTVREGEIFIIMGLSGSGKSTLVRCLSRLIEPTAGEVEFDGRDLLAASEARADRAPPPQDGHGVPALRAAAASHRARERRLSAGGPGRAPGPRAAPGAGDDRARRPDRPRRRSIRASCPAASSSASGIARSLAVKPEIWFLDEPFSALDPLIRREMQDELLRLQGAEEDHRLHHP